MHELVAAAIERADDPAMPSAHEARRHIMWLLKYGLVRMVSAAHPVV